MTTYSVRCVGTRLRDIIIVSIVYLNNAILMSCCSYSVKHCMPYDISLQMEFGESGESAAPAAPRAPQ